MITLKIIVLLSTFLIIQAQEDAYTQSQYDDFASIQFPEAKNILPEYDFIIIGAGSAGCVLANRLSENTKWKILLIEAGPSENLRLDIPLYSPENIGSEYDWKFTTVPSATYGSALNNNSLFVSRGKVVGGSSSINAMIYTRGADKSYREWFQKGNLVWKLSMVEKYFKKLENYTFDPINGRFGHNGPMFIGKSKSNTAFAKAYVDGSREAGSPTIDVNDAFQIGTSFLPVTIKNGYRFSTNRGYLIPIRDRKNLHLKINCMAVKINFNRITAKSVKFICGNDTFTVRASKDIILSAGAVGSPQLLLLSGIGPEKDLSSLKIPVIRNLLVGRNLMDHVYPAGITFTIDKDPFSSSGINEEYKKDQTGPVSYPFGSEVMSFMLPKNGEQSIETIVIESSIFKNHGFATKQWNFKQQIIDERYKPYPNQSAYTVLIILLTPKSRGWLKLQDMNPCSKPLIYHNFFYHESDVETLLEGVKKAIQVSKQPSLQKWNPKLFSVPLPQCKNFEFGTDDYWRCHIRAAPATIYHISGTNKMGPLSDPTSVVSQHLRVHGTRNLRVIDSSIMPVIQDI